VRIAPEAAAALPGVPDNFFEAAALTGRFVHAEEPKSTSRDDGARDAPRIKGATLARGFPCA